MTNQVDKNDARNRYEILVDGELAGFARYRNDGDVVVFEHTEVDDRFQGQGLATEMVRTALDDVRAQGPLGAAALPARAEVHRRECGVPRSRTRRRQSRVRPVAVRSIQIPRGRNAAQDVPSTGDRGDRPRAGRIGRHGEREHAGTRVRRALRPIPSASSSRTTTASARRASRRSSTSSQLIPNAEVTVIAPATNQSGTGAELLDRRRSRSRRRRPRRVTPATAVGGFPADTVLYGVLTGAAEATRPRRVRDQLRPEPRQRHRAVGHRRCGAAPRTGSASRRSRSARDSRTDELRPGRVHRARLGRVVPIELRVRVRRSAQTLNINVPTCPSAAQSVGSSCVPLGRTSDVGGYTLQSGSIGNGTFAPTVVTKNALATANCHSTRDRLRQRHRCVQQRLRDAHRAEPGSRRSLRTDRSARSSSDGVGRRLSRRPASCR